MRLGQRPPAQPDGATGLPPLPKAPTGIHGLDEVTGGGLPRGRPTLVCGPAGCGKTLLGIEFLVRGITEFGENGVFLAFEETREDLIANVASLGFDLARLEADGQLAIDHVSINPSQMEESGEWDLEGLFIRLGAAIDEVGADRVVIDTIENLFGAFSDTATLRAELRRLFGWLKARGVTAIITGERGEGSLTRHGIEEYVSDCVIVLDHRVSEQTSTRRLRVVKYRGSLHGTNEYPFIIGRRGVSVVPITSLSLEHDVSNERLSTGVPRLDVMLGGPGVFRGSSILVSGRAGTGKSTVAVQFSDAACARGERALYFAFEESQAQIVRNMASVGMDLARWVDGGLLQFKCVRPSLLGLEAHLSAMQDLVLEYQPSVVVMDPISDLLTAGLSGDVSAMLTRLVDFLKVRGVTALFTSLDQEGQLDGANHQIAPLIDVWLLMRTHEGNSERNRSLSVLKARGTAHSNQIREFHITSSGLELADVHGLGTVLTGSARLAEEARQRQQGGAEPAHPVPDGSGQEQLSSVTPRTGYFAAAGEPMTPRSATEPIDSAIEPIDSAIEPIDTATEPIDTGIDAGIDAGIDTATKSASEVEFCHLRLYVAGQSPKSLKALANLKRLCEEHLPARYEIEVVDLVENPRLAAGDEIIAIPTLVRRLPEPVRKIIGDLSDSERVIVGLQLLPSQR